MKRKRRKVTVQPPFGVAFEVPWDVPAVIAAADGVP